MYKFANNLKHFKTDDKIIPHNWKAASLNIYCPARMDTIQTKRSEWMNTFIVQKCVQQSNHLYSLRYTQSSGKVPQACHQACPPPHTCPRTAWQPWSTRGAACSVQTRTATSCAVSLPERNLAAAPAGTDPRCYSQTTQSLSTSACWWLTRTLTKPTRHCTVTIIYEVGFENYIC